MDAERSFREWQKQRQCERICGDERARWVAEQEEGPRNPYPPDGRPPRRCEHCMRLEGAGVDFVRREFPDGEEQWLCAPCEEWRQRSLSIKDDQGTEGHAR
jgi:hypothetical protein